MKGTRRDVLIQLESWLNGEEDKHVFWLNGLAGTGKSTIAQTFAEMSFADGKLGASFFCSRDFEDRRNLQIIFPTLAFQLARRYSRFREELLLVLKTSPDLGRESLSSQMEKLIVGPLKTTHDPTLIIIDALDECKDEEPASAILSILSRYVEQIPHVKFFITGRPEPRIRSGFRLPALRPITEVFKLHDIERLSVDADIKLFLRTRLAEIAKNRSDCDFPGGWPRLSHIDILCEKVGGLFIYASTAVKFVASPLHLPPERLVLLVSLRQNTVHEGGSGIDSLYTGILRHAYRNLGPDNPEVYRRFRTVVGAVLLAFNPLSMESLSSLLPDFDTSEITIALNPLHSLLLVPEGTDGLIRTFHKSFPDFLMDLERCQDTRFFVDPPVHHTEILLPCLHLMEKRLKKNICDLDDYADLSNVDDLSARRKVHIGDALEYACRFWTKHLIKSPSSGPDAERVREAIDRFFTRCLLFWIEVLIIIESLDVSVHLINDIRQWYISVSCGCIIYGNIYSPLVQGNLVCEWADDSQYFILEHYDIICNSPSQIYHYALPFSPFSSQLRKCYIAEFSREVRVIKGAKTKWETCSRTVPLESSTLALSYWNNTIAVGSRNGDIIILHAITGSQIAVFSGHTQEVTCFTFSSDGKTFVSGSNDKTIKLWDMQTGGVIKPFCGHTKQVQSVSISEDCTRIVSGSTDNTICLWDIETGECFSTIKQRGPVHYVGFSPMNSEHIISISYNRVQQWDVKGHQIPSVYNGTHIAFSPDNTQFALCNGKVVTVRKSNPEATVADFHITDGFPKYCCFSPDNRLVAVAAGNTVYVQDLTSPDPHLIATFVGHTSTITSLIFSSPSSLISASKDSSIKFWQIGTLSTDTAVADPEFTPHASLLVESVSLQAGNKIAVSSDISGVVKAWDILTGHCRVTFKIPDWHPNKRVGDVKQIGDRWISVWYEGTNIYVWDVEKREPLQTLKLDGPVCNGLRISGDGSKIICLSYENIQAWSMWTWESVGKVKLVLEGMPYMDPLCTDSSRVWICFGDSSAKEGWDFGISSSSPVPFDPSTGRPCLDLIGYRPEFLTGVPWIKDTVTGKEVFCLRGRYTEPKDVQWDGQYFVAGYTSGEVLILDFYHILSRDM